MLISQLIRTARRPPISLPRTATLRQAVQLMADEAIGAVVIVGPAGGLDGLLAERDVARAVACGGAAVVCDGAGTWMRTNVPTVTPDTQVRDAVALITARRARRLPVLEAERVVAPAECRRPPQLPPQRGRAGEPRAPRSGPLAQAAGGLSRPAGAISRPPTADV